MDLSGVSPYLTTKNIIYHLDLQNNIDMVQVCKIRDINVSGKINKITTTQKITLISNNVRTLLRITIYTPFAVFGKSIFVMVFFPPVFCLI